MSDTIRIQEEKRVVIVDDDNVKVVSVGTQGPEGPKGDPGSPGEVLVESVNGKQGKVVLEKADIGLGDVDNTSDLDKPVSEATQEALDARLEKDGDTMTGSLEIDAPTSGKALHLKSSDAGGLNSFDSTARIQLESYQKAQKNNDTNTNTQQAHYGEVLRIDLKHKQAKGVIAIREDYLGAPEGARTVAWLVAHGEANDSTPENPVWHNHFSIELPDENGALQTSLEFPFAPFNQPNAFGMPMNDRYVRSVVALVAAANAYVEGENGVNKNLYFSSKKYKDEAGKRWGIQTDSATESGSNAGSDFRINRYTDDGSFAATPLFIKRSNGQIGINQTTPSASLDVVGTTELNGAVTIPTSSLSIGNTAAQGGAKLYIESAISQVGMLFRNTTGAGNTAANIVSQSQTSGSRAFQAGVQSDSINRFSIEHSGLIEWGAGGSSGRDTNLYRSAANTLATDDFFTTALGVLPSANLAASLGGVSQYWATAYVQRVYFNSTAYIDGSVPGRIDVTAGVAFGRQINLASITAPASPANGDIWFDGTSLKMRIGGATKTFTIV